MSPYDMLRSILGQSRTDDEIEAALAVHGNDLSAAIVAIMESQAQDGSFPSLQAGGRPSPSSFGKSMATDARPGDAGGPAKGRAVILQVLHGPQASACGPIAGSATTSAIICASTYWVMGNCLAGDTCIFSHDPAYLMNKLALDGASTPPTKQATIQVSDYNSFPLLQPGTPEHGAGQTNGYPFVGITPPPGLKPFHAGESPRSRSRPGSRQQQPREASSLRPPSMMPTPSRPLLGRGQAAEEAPRKRGGHNHKDNFVRLVHWRNCQNVAPCRRRAVLRQDLEEGLGRTGKLRPIIPEPGKNNPGRHKAQRSRARSISPGWRRRAGQQVVPEGAPGGYQARRPQEQIPAEAWNRNDARAAKALSLRGQSENDLMRKAHREAARELYEERNRANSTSAEMYVDLHGLHPEEAVEYLERVLAENSKEGRPIYAITGTGHHSKSGKDKVGKAIRNFLNEWRYAYREFSVPGDRNNMGGILGIDATSYDKSLARSGAASPSESSSKEEVDILSQGVEIGDGKVRLLVRDPPKGPSGRRS
ncbi:CCCH zinc finger and SMR domain-containing protein [Verticillium alfalfae VaMs.102]|uniref:CCCH zinc finger and SMR domain-containing protein n=1 Tax=Verticillium alfalfae (strain VaMs.102 / ATCC MYA-4576 / FGSC 10136) TaxID=526221 RepID=C9SI62_VERA1|nr:CCCH zinc finger and SMR domain-containing protein [Verticillium alfalfae VaMs.102]EEY18635.1 CCCH zinc finger and SMR domain-containing protein [Verticillium alfalfae VaMs.102]